MKFEIINGHEKTNQKLQQADFNNGVCKIEIKANQCVLIEYAVNRIDNLEGFTLTIEEYKFPITFMGDMSKSKLLLFLHGDSYKKLQIMNNSHLAQTLLLRIVHQEEQESSHVVPNVSLYYKQI